MEAQKHVIGQRSLGHVCHLDECRSRSNRLVPLDCYIFDRQISIRTGRAFWSRGPALCFRGYSHVEQVCYENPVLRCTLTRTYRIQTGPAGGRENFPSLCDLGLLNDKQGNTHQQSGPAIRESGELLQACEFTECPRYRTSLSRLICLRRCRIDSK
jgi:hypothetical protein